MFTFHKWRHTLLIGMILLLGGGLFSQTMETLPSGTLIIPMDNSLQGSGGDFNLRAYGLAVHLLHADVPLKWIISSTKAKDGTDFSATAQLTAPSTGASALRNFKAGPIAVYPGFETQALAVIASFNTGTNDVNVFELTQSVSVPVAQNLTHKPKAAALDNGGNADIHTDIYDAAGLLVTSHYSVELAPELSASACFTFASEPHVSPGDVGPSIVAFVKDFVQSGGNFLAQCEGVEAYSSAANGSLLATYSSKPGIGGTIQYDNISDPYNQFEGLLPDQGGSVTSFIFGAGNIQSLRKAYDSSNPNNYKSYSGSIGVYPGKTAGGYVHYLAGHEYSNGGNGTNGQRMLLNAFLRQTDRPGSCGLSITPDIVADNATIDCGASVTIDVLANDNNPFGGSLTVTLVGSGSYGTFVNNNDGTVTYTPNTGFWGGPDVITYEACTSGGLCGSATITVSAGSNVKIGGTVFNDLSQDGVLDMGETGQGSVTVRLYEDNIAPFGTPDGAPIQTQASAVDGSYQFTYAVAAPTTGTIDVRVTNDDDDAREKGNGDVETDQDFKFKDGDDAKTAIRFTGITIPANAIITNAYIEFTADSDKDKDPISTTIRGETASETPAGFIDGNPDDQLTDRLAANGTASSVSWNNIPEWVDLQKYQTPDLSAVVQDIRATVKSSATAAFSGNMVFFFNSTGSEERKAFDYGSAANAGQRPRLVIAYEIPSPVGDFLVDIDPATLPAGTVPTSATYQTASLFTAGGQLDCNNDFGFAAAPTAQIAQMCDGNEATQLYAIGTGFPSGQWEIYNLSTTTVLGGPYNNGDYIEIDFSPEAGQFIQIRDASNSSILGEIANIPGGGNNFVTADDDGNAAAACDQELSCPPGGTFDLIGNSLAGAFSNANQDGILGSYTLSGPHNGNFNAIIFGNFTSGLSKLKIRVDLFG